MWCDWSLAHTSAIDCKYADPEFPCHYCALVGLSCGPKLLAPKRERGSGALKCRPCRLLQQICEFEGEDSPCSYCQQHKSGSSCIKENPWLTEFWLLHGVLNNSLKTGLSCWIYHKAGVKVMFDSLTALTMQCNYADFDSPCAMCMQDDPIATCIKLLLDTSNPFIGSTGCYFSRGRSEKVYGPSSVV